MSHAAAKQVYGDKNIRKKSGEQVKQNNNHIHSAADYIREVVSRAEKLKKQDGVIVYRGETQEYAKACRPNIFRQDLLRSNPFFEKNLFDEMSANHITDGSRYLEKAIDAQHGGFPSRLLDVTYNCLIALYFAVTPQTKKEEASYDGKDGMVYLFSIERMYSPTSDNINKSYDAMITREPEWFQRSGIFRKNHKLIDHIKMNKRIIAQQGAFILFQGDEAEPIPSCQYERIRIPGEVKGRLRRELKNFFGIYTGMIYPETENLIEEITRKSNLLNSASFSLASEMELVFGNLNEELDDSFKRIFQAREVSALACQEAVIGRNKMIRSYRRGLAELYDYAKKCHAEASEKEEPVYRLQLEEVGEFLQRYNRMVEENQAELAEVLEGVSELQTEQFHISIR